MKLADVRKNAFAMPLNNPAYPRGPYRFYNREFVVISYRTDPERLGRVVRKHDALFVVDAIQALGVVPTDVEAELIDVMLDTVLAAARV